MMLIFLGIISAVYFTPVFAKNQSFGKRLMKFLFLGGTWFLAGIIFVTMMDIFFPVALIAPPIILIGGYRSASNW